MENKKFNIIRYIVIILTCLCLVGIEMYKRNIDNINNNEDDIIILTKEYINDNASYFNELFKEKDIEYRINTKDLISSDKYVGYVNVINNQYKYVQEEQILLDKIYENNKLVKNEYNENMPYDLNYFYKGINPNNYIKFNDNLYRIIGITNNNELKLISLDNYNNITWGLSNNIDYFIGESLPKEDSNKGIFYVGYIRSETKDIESIIKNEKRNNNYTISAPKYYGYYSFINISDIINASENCSYNNILDINKDNCDSYLIDMLKGTYTSNTLEDNKVYKIDEESRIISTTLEDSIQAKKVIYVHGISKYISGDGSLDNPYEFEN